MCWWFWRHYDWLNVDCLNCSGVDILRVVSISDGNLWGVLYSLDRDTQHYIRKDGHIMARSFVDDLLKKKKSEATSDYAASDEELANWVPLVYELLTRKVRDDKKVFGPASIAIWASQGSWHASLNHRSLGYRWMAEGSTFRGAIEALQRAIETQEGAEANGSGHTRAKRV